MGSSLFQLQQTFPFFFSHQFFFLIPATGKTTPKKISLFSSIPNKFIKIYFIHFFPVLYTVKPLKKKTPHNFFFINSRLFAQNFSNIFFLTLTLVFNILFYFFSYVLFTKHTTYITQHITIHVMHTPFTHQSQQSTCYTLNHT